MKRNAILSVIGGVALLAIMITGLGPWFGKAPTGCLFADQTQAESPLLRSFNAKRAALRSDACPSEDEMAVAQQRVQEAKSNFQSGTIGWAELNAAQVEWSKLQLAKTKDQKYADEIIAAKKAYYDVIKAQFDAGHPNGTTERLARSALDWKEAALLYAAPDSPPDPDTIRDLLDAAAKLVSALQASFDTGHCPLSDLMAAKAELVRVEREYRPLLEVVPIQPTTATLF